MSAYRVHAPFVFVPTLEARQAIGRERLRDAARAAFQAVSDAARVGGLSVAHVQVSFAELTIGLCSRVRADGLIEIEAGLGDPRLPARSFSQAALQKARAEIEARRRRAERASGRWLRH